MTREDAIKSLSNTKVFVKDKSEEIQKKLFEIGFSLDDESKYLNYPFLFLRGNKRIGLTADVKDFYSNKYREITVEDILDITIDTEYRPFNCAKECWQEMQKHEPFGWIKRKREDYWFTLINVGNDRDYDSHFENYIFADGEPFGIKED